MGVTKTKKLAGWEIPTILYKEIAPDWGDMRKRFGEVFTMFAAFIGETPDFGESIKNEFPLAWKLVNAMEMEK